MTVSLMIITLVKVYTAILQLVKKQTYNHTCIGGMKIIVSVHFSRYGEYVSPIWHIIQMYISVLQHIVHIACLYQLLYVY